MSARPARLTLTALAAAALAFAAPGQAAAPAPQVVDPAGDANGLSNAQANSNQSTPAGSQDYADVTSVLWQAVKAKGKLTGFTVTAKLTGAPTPPTGTQIVYRMLATPSCGTFFGVVYYTAKSSDPTIPQSAVRDDCTGETRLTPIALPKISGSTITWTVPMSAIPKDTKIAAGKKVADLRFEIREIEDLHTQIPEDVPTYGGSYGLGVGLLDDGTSEAVFTFA